MLIQVTPTGREARHLLEKFRNQYKQEVQTLGNVRTSLLLYGLSDGDMPSAYTVRKAEDSRLTQQTWKIKHISAEPINTIYPINIRICHGKRRLQDSHKTWNSVTPFGTYNPIQNILSHDMSQTLQLCMKFPTSLLDDIR